MVVSPRRVRTLALTATLVALALVVAMAGWASASTKHGITPLTPSSGTSVPAGKSMVLRMRVKGPGQVWVHVCRSKRRNAAGVICIKTPAGQAMRKNGVFEFKPRLRPGLDGYWLNKPGRYYWQAHRIYCNSQDCRQEGPVVRFRVK
jgi:hypothetical protein